MPPRRQPRRRPRLPPSPGGWEPSWSVAGAAACSVTNPSPRRPPCRPESERRARTAPLLAPDGTSAGVDRSAGGEARLRDQQLPFAGKGLLPEPHMGEAPTPFEPERRQHVSIRALRRQEETDIAIRSARGIRQGPSAPSRAKRYPAIPSASRTA
jgi:hypothetical protein